MVIVRTNFLTKGMTIPRRKLLAVVLLFSSSFAWFFVFYRELDVMASPNVAPESFWIDAGLMSLLVSIVISALLGSYISGKVNRRRLVLLWLIVGVLVTIPILLLQGDEFLVIWGAIAGLSFGIGFPSCLAYLAESTAPDERGRVAGIAVLVTFILLIFSMLLIDGLGLKSTGILLLTLGIKSIGFLSFKLDSIGEVRKEAKPWRAILGYRDFNRYFLAFVLFMVAAGLVSLVWQGIATGPDYIEVERTALLLRYLGLIVFATIAGVMADRIGRKKPIIAGLVMLGAAYAIVVLLTTPEIYFVNLLLSGFAWGIIIVVYLVVPGDLAFLGSTERFYTVGWVLPLILYTGIQGVGRFVDFPIRTEIFSMILTMVLFVAIIPLLSAVETLSESKIRETELRKHAEKVSKLIQETHETDEK